MSWATFGIDFGTTNTSAVEIDGRVVHQFGDEQGKPLPSVIILNHATDQVIGGRDAWNRRLELQQLGGFEIVGSIKRCLESDRHWVTAGRSWTPTDIAAEVLKQLSIRAQKEVAAGIRKATFSIPVGLSARARSVLRDAAALAGIEVSSFVVESTAAFVRYFETSETVDMLPCSIGAAAPSMSACCESTGDDLRARHRGDGRRRRHDGPRAGSLGSQDDHGFPWREPRDRGSTDQGP